MMNIGADDFEGSTRQGYIILYANISRQIIKVFSDKDKQIDKLWCKSRKTIYLNSFVERVLNFLYNLL